MKARELDDLLRLKRECLKAEQRLGAVSDAAEVVQQIRRTMFAIDGVIQRHEVLRTPRQQARHL